MRPLRAGEPGDSRLQMRMVRSWDPEHSTSGTWDFMGLLGALQIVRASGACRNRLRTLTARRTGARTQSDWEVRELFAWTGA